MNNNSNQPREYDAVLGGQTPPINDAVLGGIEGIKRRLASSYIEVRLAAIKEALNYQDEGLELVIQALYDGARQVRHSAHQLLQTRREAQVQQALQNYKDWNLFERIAEPLEEGYLYYPLRIFAGRKVEEFKSETAIEDPISTAYVIDSNTFTTLARHPQFSKVEALILKNGYDWMHFDKDYLMNVKALFDGPYDTDFQISWTQLTDVSFILEEFPQLEFLQARGSAYGSAWHNFSSLRHENLKVLIVESGGISRETVTQICTIELPELEHLELWLGSSCYGGTSSIEDLNQIFIGKLFPKINYLGLRNSEYSDDIAAAIVDAPIIDMIKVLDLSLGTLGDRGAEFLLQSPAVNRLDLLNVSESFLSDEMIERLQQLDVQVIANNQKGSDEDYRYCSVAE